MSTLYVGTVPPENTTWAEVVRAIAAEYGRAEISDEEIDFLLWERTPWPIGGWDSTVAALHVHFKDPK